MSQAFIFRKDCWIYTKKRERERMQEAIKYLKKYRSLCISGFVYHLGGSEHSVRLAVFYLVGAGVLNVKQRNEVRIFRLDKNWERKLKNALTPPSGTFKNKKVGVIKEEGEGRRD